MEQGQENGPRSHLPGQVQHGSARARRRFVALGEREPCPATGNDKPSLERRPRRTQQPTAWDKRENRKGIEVAGSKQGGIEQSTPE